MWVGAVEPKFVDEFGQPVNTDTAVSVMSANTAHFSKFFIKPPIYIITKNVKKGNFSHHFLAL